ncbi:MAG: sigma-54 interaction domain-containing protein [Bacteroidales bacterium]
MLRVPEELVCRSAAMRSVVEEASRWARCDAKILLTGESGVGKELVARLVHARSQRASRPLVTVNCAGVPDTLLESELFGHMRGSFTDAVRDKAGLLEVADGGTVFLDEVGEMSLKMQTTLLRFLENGEIQRVGAPQVRHTVDVRVIAATNRDLREQVREGAFREDLFYRLDVLSLHVPALRERREDVRPLLEAFLGCFCAAGVPRPEITAEAAARLEAYRWPGNVRELRNVVESLVARYAGQRVGVAELPRPLQQMTGEGAPRAETFAGERLWQSLRGGASFWSVVYAPFMARDLTREDVRFIVRKGLEHTRGNYTMLVQVLNVDGGDYKRFLNFLRKHDCHEPVAAYRTMSAA